MDTEALILAEISGSEYRSGEQISRKLGITRSAVWKHIAKLRESGYRIDARPRRGYRLVSRPDKLLPAEIASRLDTDTVGSHIVHRERVESTTEVARELIRGGTAGGTVVIAEEQSAGRGRMGRSWVMQPGRAIAMSVVLYPRLPPSRISILSLATAVAAVRAIGSVTGVEPDLKWPNDIYHMGRKLGGVLVEISAELDRIGWVIDSIGLNVNDDFRGTGLEQEATSLSEATGGPVARLDLVVELLRELDSLWRSMGDEKGVELYRSEFQERDILQGNEVNVATPEGTVRGIATGIDREGRLLVRTGDGSTSAIFSGEATLAV